MAISRVGAATVAGTSLTPSWSGAGAREIEIAWAYRSGSATPPSLPSGWTRIKQEGANTNSGLLAYRFCPTSGNVATGTFSNATQLIVTRYAGVKGIGNVASSAVSSNSISYPALTMVQSAGNSWIFGAGGHRTATNVNTAPSGMTNITSVSNICAVHDTNAAVSSWAGASASVNASSGHESMTIELLADGGAWSLYDSTGAPGWSLNTQNKVAQRDGAVGAIEGIRQFTGRSTGKWAAGFRLISFGDTFDITLGLVTGPVSGGQSLTAWPDSGVVFVCDTDTAAGNAIYYNAGTQVDFGSGNMIQAGEYGSICFDLDAGKIWICHQSMTDWNNDPTANPNAGTGGISYTTGKGSVLFLWHSTGNQGSSFAINTFTLNDVAPTWTFPANASDFQPWDNPATLHTAAANLSGAGALTAVGSGGKRPSATLSGTSALAAAGSGGKRPSITFSGTGSLSATATLEEAGGTDLTASAMLSGAGSMAAAAAGQLRPAASLSGTSTLTAATRVAKTASAALSATSSLATVPNVQRGAIAALLGVGSMAAAAARQMKASGALNGTGTMTASATQSGQGQAAATLSGSGTMTASAYVARRGIAALAAESSLAASARKAGRASADFAAVSSVLAGGLGQKYGRANLLAVSDLTARAELGSESESAIDPEFFVWSTRRNMTVLIDRDLGTFMTPRKTSTLAG